MISMKILWSIVSNAALRSKGTSAHKWPSSINRAMSLTTAVTAVSVEWWTLYADWCAGSKLFRPRCSFNLDVATRSTSFDKKLRLELGRQDLRSNWSMFDFLIIGLTTADFRMSGNLPSANESLTIVVTTGESKSQHCFTTLVGTRIQLALFIRTSLYEACNLLNRTLFESVKCWDFSGIDHRWSGSQLCSVESSQFYRRWIARMPDLNVDKSSYQMDSAHNSVDATEISSPGYPGSQMTNNQCRFVEKRRAGIRTVLANGYVTFLFFSDRYILSSLRVLVFMLLHSALYQDDDVHIRTFTVLCGACFLRRLVSTRL